MNDRPAAQVRVDEPLVRALLREQHPDLAGLPVTPLAEGWDNAVVRVGSGLLARMPRREAAVRLVENEQRWLPVLAPGLPLAVPVPVRSGLPGAGYPWPWSLVAHLPGDVAARTPPQDPEAARVLGAFLARLHGPAPADAPANPVRGVPLQARAAAFAANLAAARAGGTLQDRDGRHLFAAWERALASPAWVGPPLWLHGDLHPANVLVDGGRITAVIDFGDLTAGDPATDLAVGWMLLPPVEHASLWDVYAAGAAHPVDGALRARAAGWAAMFASVFLAHSDDDPVLARVGRSTVAALAAR